MNSIAPLQEKLSEVAVRNGDALKSMVEIALSTSEQLLALNLNVLRSYAASTVAPLRGSVKDRPTAQSNLPAQTLELASDYMRNAMGICIKSQSEMARLDVKRINDLTQSMSSLLEGIAETGPEGSVEVAKQIEAALNGAAEAYEKLINTSTEIAERNLDTASHALEPIVAAVRNGTKLSKKAA